MFVNLSEIVSSCLYSDPLVVHQCIERFYMDLVPTVVTRMIEHCYSYQSFQWMIEGPYQVVVGILHIRPAIHWSASVSSPNIMTWPFWISSMGNNWMSLSSSCGPPSSAPWLCPRSSIRIRLVDLFEFQHPRQLAWPLPINNTLNMFLHTDGSWAGHQVRL